MILILIDIRLILISYLMVLFVGHIATKQLSSRVKGDDG